MEPRDKIFEAAMEEFATHGYRSTTIRDICARAGVNVAAVNYYFSGKAELYSRIFEYLFCKDNRDSTDIFHNAETPAEAKERLKNWITTFLHQAQISKIGIIRHRIMLHEMFEPSELFNELMDKHVRPEVDIVLGWFKMCMPQDTSDEKVAIAFFGMLSNTLFYYDHPNLVRVIKGNDFFRNNVDAICDFVISETMRHFV